MGNMMLIRYIFMSPISENQAIWPYARQNFNFQKVIETFKIYIYLGAPKMGQLVF